MHKGSTRTVVRVATAILATSLVACGGLQGDDQTPVEYQGEISLNEEGKEDSSTSVSVYAGRAVSFSFSNPSSGSVSVTVDCSPSASPDVVGVVFSVKAPSLGIPYSTSQASRAGYWKWTGT